MYVQLAYNNRTQQHGYQARRTQNVKLNEKGKAEGLETEKNLKEIPRTEKRWYLEEEEK